MSSILPLQMPLVPNHKRGQTSASRPTPAPDIENTIRFTTVDELFEHISHVEDQGNDFLTVTNISQHDFSLLEQEREARRRRFRFRRFSPDTKTLAIAIPSGIHEKLHAELYRILDNKIFQANLDRRWTVFHAKKYYMGVRNGSRGGGGGGSSEGDSAGGPDPERLGKWPTFVIEAGYSESMTMLERDMRWWFAASNHDVKIVIAVKFNRGVPSIILRRWEEEPSEARSGATMTRSASTLTPVSKQTITITQNIATVPPTYNVDRTALVLSFRLLFLRDPGPGEGDFIIDIADLQHFARLVWSEIV